MLYRFLPSPLTLLVVALLLLLPGLLYWQVFLQQGVFFFGDIIGQNYPLKVEAARSLSEGSLPWWTPRLMAGYPLLAEAEGGYVYPLGVLFSVLFSPANALSLQLLFHLSLAGIGRYLYLMLLERQPLAAFLGGSLYALSGFALAHLNHLSVTSALPWLPFQFMALEQMFRQRRAGPCAVLLAGLIWLLVMAGHAQMLFLSLLALSAYALFRAVIDFLEGNALERPLVLLSFYALAVLFGLGAAAPQLLSTLELTDLSLRAGGVAAEFFTSFSLPPPYTVSFIAPFVFGNPLASNTPATFVEWCGYAGVGTLVLAAYGLGFRRDRYSLFFVSLLLVSLVLAFGQWNPLYHLLHNVPGFNLFRVPARYLFLYSFALTVLAGLGAAHLLRPGDNLMFRIPRPVTVPTAATLLLLLCAMVWAGGNLERLLAAWQLLPPVLLLLSVILVAARARMLLGWRPFALMLVLLCAVDLFSFNAVFAHTLNATLPSSQLAARPDVLRATEAEREPFRIYTHDRIYPSWLGVREALSWNMALAHNVESFNGYLPLTLGDYQQYRDAMQSAPRLADLANIRYLLIPQSIGAEAEVEHQNLENPLSPSLNGRLVAVGDRQVSRIDVESHLSNSMTLADGTPAAELELQFADGSQRRLPLRVGLETAEWAYDRLDVRAQVKHSRPQVARSWPARTAYPPQTHNGNTYLARFDLAGSPALRSVCIVPILPPASVQVQRVTLLTTSGERLNLAQLAGYGDYELAYRGNEAVAYRNTGALPRLRIVHQAQRAESVEEALRLVSAPTFDAVNSVVLGPEQPARRVQKLATLWPSGAPAASSTPLAAAAAAEDAVTIQKYEAGRIRVHASLRSDGYLLLADSYYPGWHASVDGKPAQIERANGLFRAVALSAGVHLVEMEYRAVAGEVGTVIALTSLLGLLVLLLLPYSPQAVYSRWR